MKTEDQRIAIATACKWTDVRPATILKGRIIKSGIWGNPPGWEDGGYTKSEIVPNYLEDLNAMHEAEKTLTPTQRIQYADKLPEDFSGDFWADAVFATAAQRAEAFLRTLNLWTA
jgi:hypothetical protein